MIIIKRMKRTYTEISKIVFHKVTETLYLIKIIETMF